MAGLLNLKTVFLRKCSNSNSPIYFQLQFFQVITLIFLYVFQVNKIRTSFSQQNLNRELCFTITTTLLPLSHTIYLTPTLIKKLQRRSLNLKITQLNLNLPPKPNDNYDCLSSILTHLSTITSEQIRNYNYLQLLKYKMLSSLSMFPYSAFWRIDGQGFMKNSCGGIATILAILILIVLSILKLNEVFKMTTIIATSSSTMSLEPPMTNVSTTQNNPAFMPYMLGFGSYQDAFFSSRNTISAEYVIMTGISMNNRTTSRTKITLENCTKDHFSVIPNIDTKASQWDINKWYCLPLNQIYEIGGSFQLSTTYKRIQINVTCDYSQNHQDCGYIKQYTLNAFVDPTSINPSTYYLSQDTFLVKAQSSYDYSSKVTKHTLIVDNNVWFTPKILNTTSIDTTPIVLQESTSLSALIQTTLKIEVSGKSVTYTRSYLKILDALSYIGGIFNSILAVFFFIEGFNRYFFQMRFSNEYFKTKQTKKIDFITYLKSSAYPFLKEKIGYQPKSRQWLNCSKHEDIKKTVNKLLDVIYLNKRIAFLEEAISVLFTEHQLKGLHLMKSMTKQEAEKRHFQHKFRERLIYFIHKTKAKKGGKIKINDQSEDQEDYELQQYLEQDEKEKGSDKQNQALQSNKVKSTQQLQGNLLLKGGVSVFTSHNKMISQNENDRTGTNKNLINQDDFGEIVNAAEEEYKAEFVDQSPQMIMQREKHRRILREQVAYIGKIDEDTLKVSQIIDELQQDLKVLIEQAENNSNPISVNIYNKMESWLKQELKLVIHQQVKGQAFNKIRSVSKIKRAKSKKQ